MVAFLTHEKRLEINYVSRVFFNVHVPFACTDYPHISLKKLVVPMLNTKPVGSIKKVIDRWEATNPMTIEIFKAYWQKISPQLRFPGTKASEYSTYTEWAEDDWKY